MTGTLALPGVDRLRDAGLVAAYADESVALYHCAHAELAAAMRAAGIVADAMIVDAPYSERTHAGHDDGIAEAAKTQEWADANGHVNKRANRRSITYGAWSPEDVAGFVEAWAPLVRGWVASVTDHVLGPAWYAAYEAVGRYAFSPLAFVAPGSRPRLSGDGPAQWSTFIYVSRPRTREAQRWGSLDGGYVLPPGQGGHMPWIGGKPVWLIRALVRDYSRPGDLIVDPCCGAGTLGVAVRYEGRRALLCDRDEAAVLTTIKRLRGERTKPTRADFPELRDAKGNVVQPALFAQPSTEAAE